MGLETLAAFGCHSAGVYGGAKATGMKKVGLLKAIVAAFMSYIAVLIVTPLFWPLRFIPFAAPLLGAIVLAFGTAIASKVVLNCEWKQAQTIGVIAALVNFIFALTLGRILHF